MSSARYINKLRRTIARRAANKGASASLASAFQSSRVAPRRQCSRLTASHLRACAFRRLRLPMRSPLCLCLAPLARLAVGDVHSLSAARLSRRSAVRSLQSTPLHCSCSNTELQLLQLQLRSLSPRLAATEAYTYTYEYSHTLHSRTLRSQRAAAAFLVRVLRAQEYLTRCSTL